LTASLPATLAGFQTVVGPQLDYPRSAEGSTTHGPAGLILLRAKWSTLINQEEQNATQTRQDPVSELFPGFTRDKRPAFRMEDGERPWCMEWSVPEKPRYWFSKGAVQGGPYQSGSFEVVAYAGMRPRLTATLQAVGALGIVNR
jgi:hypothetical protein